MDGKNGSPSLFISEKEDLLLFIFGLVGFFYKFNSQREGKGDRGEGKKAVLLVGP